MANVDIQNVFNGTIERTELVAAIGIGSQIEGITVIDEGKYFLSREKVNTVVSGFNIVINQALFRIDNGSFTPLGVDEFDLTHVKMYPNPTNEILYIKGITIKHLTIIDANGKKIFEQKKANNQIEIKQLTPGIYFLKIVSENNTLITKKFIKN